jgi:hypothetical protein
MNTSDLPTKKPVFLIFGPAASGTGTQGMILCGTHLTVDARTSRRIS